MDVTKAKIIGTVHTRPVGYTFGGINRTLPATSYPVVDIISAPNNKVSYVTNRWYKEYKRVPLIIHEDLVDKYEPIKE